MITKPNRPFSQQGFTLLEVLLVLVLMGMIAGSMSFNFNFNSPTERVEKEAKRFLAVFNIAAEFSLLNNIQLGVITYEDAYTFVGFDGERWSSLSDEELLEEYQLPENISLQLTIGEIPWLDEQGLMDGGLFEKDKDDDDVEEEEDEEQKIVPQFYLFSSGDITPFELYFVYQDEFSLDDPVSYVVKGEFILPLTLEGPVEIDL